MPQFLIFRILKKWFRQKDDFHNITAVVQNLAFYLNVPVCNTTIENELINHYSYPSLLAVSDVLSKWIIQNKIFKIE